MISNYYVPLKLPVPINTSGFEDGFYQLMCKCFSQIDKVFNADIFENYALYSDYSGESNGHYYVYTFLLTPLDYVGNYWNQIEDLRDRFRCRSEMSFKDLSKNERLQNIVEGALRVSNNCLHGVVINIAVERKINSLFCPDQRRSKNILRNKLSDNGFGSWSRETVEKVLRISGFSSYIVSMFLNKKNKLFWMSDNDAVYPESNQNLRNSFIKLLNSSISAFEGDSPAFMNFNVQKDVNANWHRELIGLVDISASGLNHILTNHELGKSCNKHSMAIGSWLSSEHRGVLQKINLIIKEQAGKVYGGAVDIGTPIKHKKMSPIL